MTTTRGAHADATGPWSLENPATLKATSAMNRLTLCLNVVALALALVVSVAEVRADTNRPVGMQNRSIQEALDRVRLTPAQRQAIAGIMREQAEALRTLQADTSLSDGEKAERLRAIAGAVDERVRAVLTPEQRTWLDAALAERRGRSQRGEGDGESATSSADSPSQNAPQETRP